MGGTFVEYSKESRDIRGNSGILEVFPSGTEEDLMTGICTKDLTMTGAVLAAPAGVVTLGRATMGTVELREYEVSSALMFHAESFNLLPLSITSSSPVVEMDVDELC